MTHSRRSWALLGLACSAVLYARGMAVDPFASARRLAWQPDRKEGEREPAADRHAEVVRAQPPRSVTASHAGPDEAAAAARDRRRSAIGLPPHTAAQREAAQRGARQRDTPPMDTAERREASGGGQTPGREEASQAEAASRTEAAPDRQEASQRERARGGEGALRAEAAPQADARRRDRRDEEPAAKSVAEDAPGSWKDYRIGDALAGVRGAPGCVEFPNSLVCEYLRSQGHCGERASGEWGGGGPRQARGTAGGVRGRAERGTEQALGGDGRDGERPEEAPRDRGILNGRHRRQSGQCPSDGPPWTCL